MLLCQDKSLPEEIFQARYQPELEALVERLGCWPLLLTLARGMLTDLVVDYHLSIAEALTTITQAYQTRGVTAFRLDNVEERQRTVEACLKVSMQHLETFTHAHYHATERYQELVVFPADTDIPLSTLQLYWKASAGLEPWETTDLCARLHRLSLLLTCDLGAGMIRLHDVVRNYLIQHAGKQLPALHNCLLEAFRREHGVTRWADLPQSEAYLWRHLILHLRQVGRQEELQTTLTDLSFLTRKALYVGISALEADLALARMTLSMRSAGLEEREPSFLASLHRNIVRISHLLRQAQTEAEMGGLLLSRLDERFVSAKQRLALENELPRPFLTAWLPLPDRASSTLLRTLTGHTSAVNGCAVSSDGSVIVSASSDCTLKVWDAASGANLRTLTGHTSTVNGCAISAGGRMIVSACYDWTLKVWDALSGAERLTLNGHEGPVLSCAVSSDGSVIVSASVDHTLMAWDASSGERLFIFPGHTSQVNGCTVSADGYVAISASLDDTLKVWDASSEFKRLTFSDNPSWISKYEVGEDGRVIVSASSGRILKMWGATFGPGHSSFSRQLGSVTIANNVGGYVPPTATSCAVSADGSVIVSAHYRGLKVWDATSGIELGTLSKGKFIGDSCAISAKSRWIVAARSDTLKIWRFPFDSEHLTLSGHKYIQDCAISADGRFIVSALSDHTLKVWDTTTGVKRLTLRGHTEEVTSCAISADGSFIVSASEDNTLKIWDAATGTERLTLRGHTWHPACCAISTDGSFIVSASYDETLKVWNASSGTELCTLSGHTGWVTGCAISTDGRFIVSASHDHTLRIWDASYGVCLLMFPVDGTLYGCAFYPDGEHLVACGEHGMYFLRLVM